jgi:pyrroline-5-carboxylate reductase
MPFEFMPNIAAQFGESATCISFQENHVLRPKLVALFQDLGTAPIIDEKLMDAATQYCPSGTAHLRCAIFLYAGRY